MTSIIDFKSAKEKIIKQKKADEIEVEFEAEQPLNLDELTVLAGSLSTDLIIFLNVNYGIDPFVNTKCSRDIMVINEAIRSYVSRCQGTEFYFNEVSDKLVDIDDEQEFLDAFLEVDEEGDW